MIHWNTQFPERWPLRWRDLWFPLALFILLRGLTALIAVVALRLEPAVMPDWFRLLTPSRDTYELALPPDAPLYEWTQPWHRYDTTWYVRIALVGYRADDPAIVFPPFYPLLVQAGLPLAAGNAVLSALVVSSVACLLALILLYAAVIAFTGDVHLARRTLILLACYPTGFYLVAGYTESTFLLLMLGCLLAALFNRPWIAAICGFLVALTRIQGFLLVLPLLYWVGRRWWSGGWRALRPGDAVMLVAPLAGAAAYILYLNLNQLGSLPNAWMVEWRTTTELPWHSVITFLERLVSGQTLAYERENALAALFLLLTCIPLARQSAWGRNPLPTLLLLIAVPALIIMLMRYPLDDGQFPSLLRYAVVIFPSFIVLAALLRRRWWVVVAILLLIWQVIRLDMFVHWEWVA